MTHGDHSYTNLFSGTSMNPVGAAAMVATSASGGASINSPSPAPQQHGSNSGSKCSHSRSQPAPSSVSATPFSHHYDHQRSFEDSPLQRQQSISAAPGIAPDSSGLQRTTQSGSELLRHNNICIKCFLLSVAERNMMNSLVPKNFISIRHYSQLNGFSRKTTSRGLMNQFQ